MLFQRHITQPQDGDRYVDLLGDAYVRGPHSRLDVAVAYATLGGVIALRSHSHAGMGERWGLLEKRWLISFDYCRTEPNAVDALLAMPNSQVRVHDGAAIVKRQRCAPRLPFHPKVFHFQGDEASALVSGSGNLSRNGLTRGHEVGSITAVRNPRTRAEVAAYEAAMAVTRWFSAHWNAADDAGAGPLLGNYRTVFESAANLSSPTPTEDDSGDERPRYRTGDLTSLHLQQLRVCSNLWMDAGKLSENLGRGNPGSQLMMKRLTRVFFGFGPDDLRRNTTLGSVSIAYGTAGSRLYNLRFSDNSMDVINLPRPGTEGPPTYDHQVVRFERLANGDFRLSLGSARDRRAWESKSRAIGGLHQFKASNRFWGVF